MTESFNKKQVFAGGGIDPDFKMDAEKLSPITVSLLQKNLIFDYATDYRMKHELIKPAKDFHLPDAEYNDFIKWLSTKEYDYSTKSEEAMKDLKEKAQKEEYWDAIQSDFNHLQNEMKHDKDKDLIKNKDEIRQMLEEEIAVRYFYQNGRIEASLKQDPEVKKAIEILNSSEIYNKALQASN